MIFIIQLPTYKMILPYVGHHMHGLRTPREKVTFTARPKIHSHSQIFRYGQSIFCLPHRPKFSYIFDLCLHWVSIVRGRHSLSYLRHQIIRVDSLQRMSQLALDELPLKIGCQKWPVPRWKCEWIWTCVFGKRWQGWPINLPPLTPKLTVWIQ